MPAAWSELGHVGLLSLGLQGLLTLAVNLHCLVVI